MKYERQPYSETAEYNLAGFGNMKMRVPKFEYPISVKENFRRAYKRENPLWVPNHMTEFVNTMVATLTGAGEMDWTRKDPYDWFDWFGCEWSFVPLVGGSMLKPGTRLLDDVRNWEKGVKWPNFDEYDFEGLCGKFMKEKYDPEKITHINIGLGLTERFVAIMGGYTEAMCAFALEPEAVKEYFAAFVEFTKSFFDRLMKYVPIDMITYHDDWGTERDTFFSPKMMEELVFEPTKDLMSHIKSRGVCIEHHSCGNIKRFMPYICRTGADFMQLQARANDIPGLKAEWGDKVGFNIMLTSESIGNRPITEAIRDTVDKYARGGGLYVGLYARDQNTLWDACSELYCYSREYYDAQ
ncbi:MAG: hypothetical protein GXY20_06720 [Clostridiales bacterium]|nr:hypothetical protein [Clostridiales bacterium]